MKQKTKKQLKIAVYTDTFLPQVNGVVTHLVSLCNFLSKKHKVRVYAPKSKGKMTLKLDKRVKIVTLKSFSFPKYPEYKVSVPLSLTALKEFSEFNPDIVHVHSPFGIGWIGLNLSKLYGKPLVASFHTLFSDFTEYNPLKVFGKKAVEKISWTYSRIFYNLADLILVGSNETKKELKKHSFKKSIKVVSYGIGKEFFRKPKTKSKNSAVYFGRLGFEKNIDVVLKAFALACKKVPLTLSIIGSGPAEKSLKDLAKELGIQKKVKFNGYLFGNSLVKEIAKHSFYVSASTIETQGIATLEAMALGLPVIGADERAMKEAVMHGRNGFLFKAGDVKQLAEYMEKLASNAKLRKKFSKESKKLASKHERENCLQEIEEIYENALG